MMRPAAAVALVALSLVAWSRSDAQQAAPRRVWAGQTVMDHGSPSPDGRSLSLTDPATGDLALRDLETGATRRLTDNKIPWVNFALPSIFSPDGKRLAYWWMDLESSKGQQGVSSLRTIGLDSSPARVVYQSEDLDGIEPQDWTTNGQYILSVITRQDRTTQLALVPVEGGALRVLKTFSDWRRPSLARVSASGRYVAYDYPPVIDQPARDIYLIDLETGRETTLVKSPGDDCLAGWGRSDALLFASTRGGSPALFSLELVDGKARGEPLSLRSELWGMKPMRSLGDGTLFYSVPTGSRDIFVAGYDPATGKLVSNPQGITQRKGENHRRPVWSPDGRFVAFLTNTAEPNRIGTTEITILSPETGERRRLAPKVGYINALAWTPDGKALVFPSEDLKSRHGFFRLDFATGEAVPFLLDENTAEAAPAFSPDGRLMFYVRNGKGLVARELAAGTERMTFEPDPRAKVIATFSGGANGLAVSPDGKWLLFAVNDSGAVKGPGHRLETIRIIPTAGGASRTLVRVEHEIGKDNTVVSGLRATNAWSWTPDSRSIIYGQGLIEGRGLAASLFRVGTDGGAPEPLTPPAPNYEALTISPDGKRLLFRAGDMGLEIWMLRLATGAAVGSRP